MSFSIIHLSDIHFRISDNHLEKKSDGLLKILNSIPLSIDTVFVVVSGDIAFSGKLEEYEVAYDFFAKIQNHLASCEKIVKFFAVPGNHDCDFSKSDSRDLFINGAIGSDIECIKPEAIACLTKPQENFFSFLQTINSELVVDHLGSLTYEYLTDVHGEPVRIIGINSAWLSEKPEIQGKLRFPSSKLKKSERGEEVCISVMHHPFSWFESNNGVKLRNAIRSTCNLALLGHQHYGDGYQLRSLSQRESLLLIEGGVLQERDVPDQSEFVRIDIIGAKYSIFRYSWQPLENFYKKIFEKEDLQLGKIDKIMEDVFEVNPEFQDFLCDPGTGFKHPTKRNLTLDDIFVYPDLSEEDLEKKKIRTIHSGSIWKKIQTLGSCIISGPEVSGKTTLAKQLFKEYINDGFVPIYINAEDGLKFQKGKVRHIISESILEQYQERNYEQWECLERIKRVIIIDNFNRSGNSIPVMGSAIEKFKELTDKIILFVDHAFKLTDTISTDHSARSFSNFVRLEIKFFGPILREKFIRKWVRVGRDSETVSHEENERILFFEHLVTEMLNKDLVPHFPIFIGSILQLVDNQQQVAINSFGQVYHDLIKAKIYSEDNKVIPDVKETILSWFAFWIFQNENKYISSENLSKIHIEIGRSSLIRFDLQEFLKECEENKLIKRTEHGVCFNYKYIYCYFLANYLQSARMDASLCSIVDDAIEKLIDGINIEDCCNTLLIYVYLAKDLTVISKVLKMAKEIFNEETLLSIDLDIKDICKDSVSLPEISYNSDLEINQAKARQAKDQEEEEEFRDNKRDHNGHQLVQSPRDEVQEAILISKSNKAVHLLGQMLRSFPASLPGKTKIEIASNGIYLGLRTLKFVFRVIKENKEIVNQELIKIIESKRPDITGNAKEYLIKNLFSMFTIFLCSGGIRRLGYCMGSPQLNSVYEDISENSKLDSIDIIELVVLLEHLRPFVSSKIVTIGKKYSHSKIHTYIGANLVNDYLSCHELDLSLDAKAEICDAFGISFQSKVFVQKEKEEAIRLVQKIDPDKIAKAYIATHKIKNDDFNN